MKEKMNLLSRLIDELPACNSYRSPGDLTNILNQYQGILDYMNSYNMEFRTRTNHFYPAITQIRDGIELSQTGQSEAEKCWGFEVARDYLKKNLHALLLLLQERTYAVA